MLYLQAVEFLNVCVSYEFCMLLYGSVYFGTPELKVDIEIDLNYKIRSFVINVSFDIAQVV